jgi:hypothetical protein
MNRADSFNAHINQYGVVTWDDYTEYQANKSYVQGSNGVVYRCKSTHTNEDPVGDVTFTYWDVAFGTYEDSEQNTQDIADLRADYEIGSAITNPATFRTALSVYSTTETATAIANAAPTAKAWVNFNGTSGTIRSQYNVSSITRNAAGDYTVNFTTAMPNTNYCVIATFSNGTATAYAVNTITKATGSVQLVQLGSVNGPSTASDWDEANVVIFSL